MKAISETTEGTMGGNTKDQPRQLVRVPKLRKLSNLPDVLEFAKPPRNEVTARDNGR